MRVRVGYDLSFQCPQETPMVFMLNVHPSERHRLIVQDTMITQPRVPATSYLDAFGNLCARLTAPDGLLRITADGLIECADHPDKIVGHAREVPVPQLPDDALVFLLGSRYCETDALSAIAWNRFGDCPGGWARVQAISDFVYHHITFGYPYARPTKTALEAFHERQGVCRDFTHLAIALCRCLNIPARYCTGYVSDIGRPPPHPPMDFAAWLEVYLEGGWYTIDPRNHVPRMGRVLIARGRDAADVAISYSFGPSSLTNFAVWTDQVAALPA